MHEKLADEDAIFRDSLIGNIEELVSILPDLNVADDPNLAKLTENIQENICRFDADILRNNKEARKEAVMASKDILNTIESVYA